MSDAVKLNPCPVGSVRLNRIGPAVPPPGAPQLKDGVWHSYSDGVESLWLDRQGKRMIEGIASTGTVNSHNYSLNPKGCIARLPVPLLFRHGFEKGSREDAYLRIEEAKIGEVIMIRKSKDGVIVRAILDDSLAGDAAWDHIQSGRARAFSGAAKAKGLVQKGVVDGARFYQEWELDEVSVCFQGANPDCLFEIFEPGRQSD